MDAFYESNRFDAEDNTEGGPNAAHQRLYQVWGERLHPHGDFSVANKAIIDYAQNFTPVDSKTENPNWVCIGPSSNPVNSNHNGVGQIHRITFDPNYGISNQTVYACTGFGGLWRTLNDGTSWEVVNTDKLPVCSVADVVINPNNNQELIIATGLADGGVELNYSPNWAGTNPIYTIGLYRSLDYGASWQPINDGFLQEFYDKGGTIRKLEISQDNPNIVFAATSNGIFRTSNAFAPSPTWIKVFSGPIGEDMDFRSVKYQPGSSNIIYASGQDIFKSVDNGNTWTSMTGTGTGLDFANLLPYEPFRINLAVTPADVDRLFAYIWGPNPGSNSSEIYIYYYDNGSWNELHHSVGYGAKEWIALAASTKNPDEYYFYWFGVKGNNNLMDPPVNHSGYIGQGYYADGHVLEFQPNNQPTDPLIFYGHHAGVSVGDLNGSGYSWEFRNGGLQNMLHWSFDDSEFESDIILTANQDCYHYYKKDDEWKFINGGGDSYSARSSGVNKDLFFLSRGDNVLYSFNMLTEQAINESSERPYDGASPTSLSHIPKTFSVKTFPNENSDFFSFSEIYKREFDWSTGHNSNDLWELDSDIGKYEYAMWRRQITELDFCYSQPDHIYLATGGVSPDLNGSPLEPKLFKTTVGGNNGDYNGVDAYTQLTYPGMGSGFYPVISGIAVHPTNPDIVWISLIGYDNIDIRVARSNDGGANWVNADPNNTLPELPVNNIVYQYGSNDVLYIATDAGVYYKDASMENWEKYGNFPNVRVTEIDINYCQNKLRAATFGRSMWEADLLPMTSNYYYTIKSGESIVWNKSMALSTGLKIESGAKLTIKGTVNIPENNKIIIEQGGELVVDGGIITNGCGHRWQGIEVWGNSSEHQYTINGHCSQGKLTLTDATIENAISAVELWKPGDYSTTGGVVVANNTVFRNNGKSIHALMYSNFHPIDVERETDNLSTFRDCTFEITEDYIPDETFYKHVDLNKVKGIRFYGCDFLMKDVEGTSDWNIGIASYSAGFQIYPRCVGPIPCTVYDDCTFRGFWSGIYGTDDIGNTFFVKQAVFTDNVHGVKVEGVNNFTVINSTFEVGHNPDKGSTCDAQDISAAGYGIYSNGSTGFAIEANEFTKYAGAPSGYYVGTYIANTEAVDVVYNNSYKNLSFANLAEGQCHIANETIEGLAYYCNTNESNYEDFKVDKYRDYGAIQTSIGSSTHAAGNEFSENAHYSFNNRGNHMIGYYYYDNYPDPVYNVAREQVAMQYANDCPDHYGGTGTNVILSSVEKQQIKAQYALDSASYLTAKATYESYTDGGDTDALLSAVETATPADRDALKSSLLNISPFLSFDALMEVVDRTDVFPDSTIFEILAANPDELRNYDLISYLGAKQNPLPSYMIDSLVQLSTTTTYKTELMNDISTYAQLKAVSRNDILRSLQNDTIANEEELMDWITKEEKVRNDQQYVAALIKDQQYNKALAVADSMVLKHGYDVTQIAEHEYYMDMLELQITLAKENRSIYSLNSTEHANIKNIADNSKGIAGIRAKAIMGLAYNEHYCNCINTDDTSGYKNAQVSFIENDPVESKLNISVEPNPASDWIAFNFELPEEVDKAAIRIMDVSGKVIHTIQLEGNKDRKIWSTFHLKPGLYLFSCHVNGYHKSGKFVITK